MRPALFVRKQIFYRRPKLIVPLGEDEAVPPQGAIELIQFVDGVGAGGAWSEEFPPALSLSVRSTIVLAQGGRWHMVGLSA